jgi:hypothetical protein
VKLACAKLGIESQGVTVRLTAEQASNPTRVGAMAMTIEVPAGVPADARERLVHANELASQGVRDRSERITLDARALERLGRGARPGSPTALGAHRQCRSRPSVVP